MLIKTLTVGQIETNCYVVTNEKTLECVVIDPGDESNTILNYIEATSTMWAPCRLWRTRPARRST